MIDNHAQPSSLAEATLSLTEWRADELLVVVFAGKVRGTGFEP